MEEQQVEMVIAVVYLHPLLARDKTEPIAEFQNERFDLSQDRGFDVALAVGVLELEKIQHVRIAEDEVGREQIFLAEFLQLHRGEVGRFAGKCRALEKHSADFLFQCARVPAFDAAHLGVEVALERVVDGYNLAKMCPTQLCPQCGHNLGIGENLHEPDHPKEISLAEAFAKLGNQLCPQRGHYSLTILRAFLFENVLANAPANLPVKRHESRVNRAGHACTRRKNQFTHV